MRFKVDENLPEEIVQLFQQVGYDATSVLRQELGGSADMAVAAVWRRENRALRRDTILVLAV